MYRDALHMNRVENGVGAGMADVEGSRLRKGAREATCFYIELKCEARKTNPADKIKVKFQPSQPEWHRKRRKVRARVFVLVQVGSGTKALRYLLPSVYVPRLASGMTEKAMEEAAFVPPTCMPEEIIEAVTDPDYLP